MINEIGNCNTQVTRKKNWIDQNKVVFGYDNCRHCCETFGWGVYDPDTRAKVAEDPHGLPYHFLYANGVDVNCGHSFQEEVTDWVHVTLEADDGSGKRLVLECYNIHNGCYYHDFSLWKVEE